MVKKHIRHSVYGFNICNIDGLTIDETIEHLIKLKNTLKNDQQKYYDFFKIELTENDSYDYNCDCETLKLFGYKLETDEEYEKRVARENAQQDEAKEQRQKHYEQLKKEFED